MAQRSRQLRKGRRSSLLQCVLSRALGHWRWAGERPPGRQRRSLEAAPDRASPEQISRIGARQTAEAGNVSVAAPARHGPPPKCANVT